MEPTRADALRLLIDAEVPLKTPGVAAPRVARAELCYHLLAWCGEQGLLDADDAPAPVRWDTPLADLFGDDEFEEFGAFAILEEFGLDGDDGGEVPGATFGALFLYLEDRLNALRRGMSEAEILADLRESLPARADNWYRLGSLDAGATLEHLLPVAELAGATAFRHRLARRYGVGLPLRRVVWGGVDFDRAFLTVWAVLFFGVGAFVWTRHPLALLAWLPFSAGFAAWGLSLGARDAWAEEIRTLGDLARYVRAGNEAANAAVDEAFSE